MSEHRHDDGYNEDPPPVEPVRRDPRISITIDEETNRRRLGASPRRSERAERVYQRSYKIGTVFGRMLAVAVLMVLGSAALHAVWTVIKFGLWR